MQSLQQRVRELEAAASGIPLAQVAVVGDKPNPALTVSPQPLLSPAQLVPSATALLNAQLPQSLPAVPDVQLAAHPPAPISLDAQPLEAPVDPAAVLYKPFLAQAQSHPQVQSLPGQQPGTPTQQPVSGSGTPGARPSPTSSTATEDSSRPAKKRTKTSGDLPVEA